MSDKQLIANGILLQTKLKSAPFLTLTLSESPLILQIVVELVGRMVEVEAGEAELDLALDRDLLR